MLRLPLLTLLPQLGGLVLLPAHGSDRDRAAARAAADPDDPAGEGRAGGRPRARAGADQVAAGSGAKRI
jgi:hypothetical protein